MDRRRLRRRLSRRENPYTGKPWALIPRGGAADVDRAVRAAHKAFTEGDWPKLNATQRGALLRKLGDLIAAASEASRRDRGARQRQAHRRDGRADRVHGAVVLLLRRPRGQDRRRGHADRQGRHLQLHAPRAARRGRRDRAVELAAAADRVEARARARRGQHGRHQAVRIHLGFGAGVHEAGRGGGLSAGRRQRRHRLRRRDVGEPLVEHPLVAKIAFTGSDATGQKIYEAAARGLKRVSMELGGKSPNIVFDDADLDNAVKGAISGIFAATGQTCIAGSRLLVQRSIHDRVRREARRVREDREDGRSDEHRHAGRPGHRRRRSTRRCSTTSTSRKGEGANAGARRRESRPSCGDGWFVEPTIFTGVKNTMRIAQEEVFGPVLSVIPFEDEEEAIAIGNDVVYGLAAGVWTQRHAARAHDGGPAAGRHGLGEHLSRGQLHVAVRRLQAERHRPRERPGHDQGVSADQERVDLDGDAKCRIRS